LLETAHCPPRPAEPKSELSGAPRPHPMPPPRAVAPPPASLLLAGFACCAAPAGCLRLGPSPLEDVNATKIWEAHWAPLEPPPYHHPGRPPTLLEMEYEETNVVPRYVAYWQSLPKYSEVSPLLAQAQRAPYFKAAWNQPQGSPEAPGGEGEIIFVLHHKTGQNLHMKIREALGGVVPQSKMTDKYEIPADMPMPAQAKIVHLVREPIDAIISGYRYHQQRWGTEVWSWGGAGRGRQDPPCFLCDNDDHRAMFDTCHFDCTYFELLNRVDQVTGVAIEALSARRTLTSMATNVARWAQDPNVLQLSIGLFNANPEQTTGCMLKFLGLDGDAALHQRLNASVQTISDRSHKTSGDFDTTRGRTFLESHPAWSPAFRDLDGALAAVFEHQAHLHGCPPRELDAEG